MYIGGLDVGTTGCKIAVYDEVGTLFKTYYHEYEVVHKNGLHEIDFNDIKKGVMSLLKEAVADCRLEALGVTSFGETFAMLDCNDNVLAPSLLYTDPRGEEQCQELCRKIGTEKLTGLTGVKPNPMYSISKIMWQRDNNPEVFQKCNKILLGEDYIIYLLTGNPQIDYSLAARTAAFDIRNKCWCAEIFEAADIDVSLMSKAVCCGSNAGTVKPEIKTLLGIDYNITIVNGAHDQVAGMIGSGAFDCGQAMDGTGTVECIPVVLKDAPTDMDIYSYGYSVVPYLDNKYACYALSFTGGATLKWFRDNFAEREKASSEQNGKNVYAFLDSLVPKEPTGLLILPHFAGAATPYMDLTSKAAIIGITLETTKYDMYKALMEGTSYEMKLNFNTLKSYAGDVTEIRATGGGATSNAWLQIKADILGTEILSLQCKEVGAAGTAALAGKTIGCYTDLQSVISNMSQIRQKFYPDHRRQSVYNNLYLRYKDIYSAVKSLGKEDSFER